jgi:hypothetical protein
VRLWDKSGRNLIGRWNAQFDLSQDSWFPAMDYPRAASSFQEIAGSGNKIVNYVKINTRASGVLCIGST